MTQLVLVTTAVVSAWIAVPVAPARVPAPNEGAGRFMKSVVSQKLAKRYDLAWETLYPAHQRVASREAYVDCQSRIPSPGAISSSVRVLRVFRERLSVAGESHKLTTAAVTVRATGLASAGDYYPFVVTTTFHALRVKGHWTWILSPKQYGYYSAGTCPYA